MKRNLRSGQTFTLIHLEIRFKRTEYNDIFNANEIKTQKTIKEPVIPLSWELILTLARVSYVPGKWVHQNCSDYMPR